MKNRFIIQIVPKGLFTGEISPKPGTVMMMLRRQFLNMKYLVMASLASLAFLSESNAASDVKNDNQQATQLHTQDASWTVRLPQTLKVIYTGQVNNNREYKSTGLFISGGDPILASMLAAAQVVTDNKLQDRASNAVQEAADKTLLPFQPFLQIYSYRDLMDSALSKVSFNGDKKIVSYAAVEKTGTIIESVPVYVMTQDRSAIILNNAITIYDFRKSNKPVYKNIVRVVSQKQDGSKSELAEFWGEDDGARLKEESARLLASSFNLATAAIFESEAGDTQGKPQKTFHYIEGNAERMERGELVDEGCNRIIIKNLRGWLMSLPVKSAEPQRSNNNQCIDILNGAL